MTAAWKVAGSLDQLLDQLNALAPRRSRASDGSIGDAAHASRESDHNPWFVLAGQAYVTARDFTHDPAGGLNCQLLADALTREGDQRVKYVIWNDRFWDPAHGWRPYPQVNPARTNRHTHHLHLSVVPDLRALTRIPWQLPTLLATEADDVSWTHDEGAPAVPDFYPGAKGPLPDPLTALGFATAHAAIARDQAAAAREVAARVELSLGDLRTEVRAQLARVVPAPEIDYTKLAAALIAAVGKG